MSALRTPGADSSTRSGLVWLMSERTSTRENGDVMHARKENFGSRGVSSGRVSLLDCKPPGHTAISQGGGWSRGNAATGLLVAADGEKDWQGGLNDAPKAGLYRPH
jgi:hypothetical protein